MTPTSPQVSILVPTYNRREMLTEALVSILKQSYVDFEIIVADNCSMDGTEQAVAALSDPRIVYFKNETNVGPVNNHNRALRLAKGNYVCFFSDDDVMLEHNLARKVAVFEQYPSVGFVHSNIDVIDGEGKITERNHWAARFPPLAQVYKSMVSSPLMEQATAFNQLYYHWIFVSMPTAIVRASVLRNNRLEMNNQLNYLYDWDLWLKVSLKTDFYYVNEVLVLYRMHKNNESRAYTSQLSPTLYREITLSKLGMINVFHQTHLHGQNHMAEIGSLVKRQLKAVGYYESYVKEKTRHFRGYLKKVLPESAIDRIKKLG